jgi:energy-coupling factor transporter ATP-binding protein EcfA2
MSDRRFDFEITEELSTLKLHSLEIQNFRCFEHLLIEKLGRVNLIVGKNGVGKTSLLEGLWLLASGASWPVLHSILYERNELVRYNLPAKKARNEQIEAIKSFFNRPVTKNLPSLFRIGGKDAGKLESLHPIGFDENEEPFWDEDATHANATVIDFELQPDNEICIKGHPKPGYITQPEWPDLPTENELLDDVIARSMDYNVVFIPVKGLSWKAQARYWDMTVVVKQKNKSILDCLHTLAPDIEEYFFRGDNIQDSVRFPSVNAERFAGGVPLAKLGEGTQRVLALALAMSVASNGYLLIDEFETGLHHNVQSDVWQTVFKLAREWNVQVFATTHSWDCVEAFQEATAEDENEEAMLIRLQHKRSGGDIEAVLYDEELLAKATRQQVEVR